MKLILALSFILSSSFSLASSSSLLSSQEACLDEAPKNAVIYEKLKRLEDGSVWVKNIHLKDGTRFVRIKDSDKNKKRICQQLGFKDFSGSRVEFDKGETVVGINGKMEVKSEKPDKTKFILNLNCH